MTPYFTKTLKTICGMALCLPIHVLAQPAGWNHKKAYSVTEHSGNSVGTYQLRMEIDTQTPIANGEMSANGDDIRFGNACTGTVLYPYWIESGINTPNTVIWVKLDSLPAGGSVPLYLFYGNASATAISSIPSTFVGVNSATDSVNNVNLSSAGANQRGFRFAPTQDVLVTAFGRYEPNGTTRYLTLFDFASQAILRQIQVGGPANQYTYGNLPSPIWLTAGTQYLMEMFTENGQNYYFGASPQMGQHMQYFDMRYCNGCDQNTFPTNSLGGMHYGYPDFWYYTKTNITPAPTYVEDFVISLADAVICKNDSVLLAPGTPGGVAPYTYTWSPATGLGSVTDSSVVASPTVSTIYALTVTDACQITASDSVTVTVNLLPQLSVPADFSICIGDSVLLQSSGTADTYTWNQGVVDSVSFSPAATQTYTLTGTSLLTGCVNHDSVTVTVNQLPNVFAGNDFEACAQSPLTLSGTGAATYVWTGGISNAVPFSIQTLGAHTYVVTGTDANGCQNTDTVAIWINDLPVVFAGQDFTLCPGIPVVLSAAGNFTVSWNNGVSNGVPFYPNQTATYVCTGTDANNCVGTDSVTITVVSCLELEQSKAFAVQVYPNPNAGQLYINLPDVAEEVHTELMDMNGRVWMNRTFTGTQNLTLDLAGLADGVYVLRVRNNGKTALSRVVLQKK